jgi:predicted ester cyclase
MANAAASTAGLLREFAVDLLSSRDLRVIDRLMHADYRLNIGGISIAGREQAYRPAIAALFEQFPDLGVTVHDVLLAPSAAALRFTEHGTAARPAGRAAAWGGIAMFRIEGGRLCEGWAEEDYYARRRQFKTGMADPIRPAHPSPWSVPCEAPDESTREAVLRWLGDPAALLRGGPVEEACAGEPSFAGLIAIDRPIACRPAVQFSAGARAAFCAEVCGSYAGGFSDIDAALAGTAVTLRIAALATVHEGEVVQVQAIADRLGLHRQLLGVQGGAGG